MTTQSETVQSETVLTATPRALRAELLLTLDSALSHHDPATQDDSNTLLFNRQKQFLPLAASSTALSPDTVAAFCAAHPVPANMADILAGLSFAEFAGAALLRVFLDLYNSGDGEGLFSGMARYTRLETRLRSAAIRASGLRSFWDRLCEGLQVPIHRGEADALLVDFWRLPLGAQSAVLRAFSRDYRSVTALARLWHSEAKLQNAEYAKKAGQAQGAASVVLSFAEEPLTEPLPTSVVDVPAVSANSLRHQVVRAPGWGHLVQALGLREARPGFGALPAGAEAIFINGGNIRAGAKQPSNPYGLAQGIRDAFPLLDLLGGVTDSFDLGESRLSVSGWIVCRENANALSGSAAAEEANARVSVWDMLDEVTATRQATERGVGQMIYNFETLCTGAQVLVRLTLPAGARMRTRGALMAALETYLEDGPMVGGQKARGFGHGRGEMRRELPGGVEARDEYALYLAEHADALREWLTDGTLGSGARVVS